MEESSRDRLATVMVHAGVAASVATATVGATVGTAALLAAGGAFATLVYEFAGGRSRRRAGAFATQIGPEMLGVLESKKDLSDGRPADPFFRAMRRVLSDLSEEEFCALRELFARVVALAPGHENQRMFGFDRLGSTMRIHGLMLERPGDPFPGLVTQERQTFAWSPVLVRLFQLLNDNGLATDVEATLGTGGAHKLVLEIDVARRVSALIN